jgi:integrase/recombinase XerD
MPVWDRFPLVERSPLARLWLEIQANLGLARNTLQAYAFGINEYLTFLDGNGLVPEVARREHVAEYVRYLRMRPSRRGSSIRMLESGAGLANSTLQQRLTVIRLYYDFLIEEGVRDDNPVGRGRYTPGKGFGGATERGLVRRVSKLPWIPTDEQWGSILWATRQEPLRNRAMLALAYDAGLRREELCTLEVADIDPSHRILRIRAETTKNRRERVVPYSVPTAELLALYLRQRRLLSAARGPLFLSESRRNYARPVSKWTWTKVVERIAERAHVPRFTTHALRHLCLTDLARAGWDVHEIASFAGHRNIQTTLQYIHLSGRELAAKLERTMSELHAERIRQVGKQLI